MAGSDHGRTGGNEGNGSGRHREPVARARNEDARARPSTRPRDEHAPHDDHGQRDEHDRGPGRGPAAGGYGGNSGYGAGNAAWGSSHEDYERDRSPHPAERPPEQGAQQGRYWPGGWGGPGQTGARAPDRTGEERWGSTERNIQGRLADYDDDYARRQSRDSRFEPPGGSGPAMGYDRDQARWVKDDVRRAGKPPKNYQRSDERIFEDLCELITRESDVDASEVEIRVERGEVTMTGTVRDRADKREIEALADRVIGVKDVHNQLRVR